MKQEKSTKEDKNLLKYFQAALTEEEKVKVEAFCKDEVQYEAVKKLLLQSIYLSGTIKKGYEVNPLINGAFSLAALAGNNPIPDAEIGAGVRAQWAGVNYLKNAFEVLDQVRSTKAVKPEEEPQNIAV